MTTSNGWQRVQLGAVGVLSVILLAGCGQGALFVEGEGEQAQAGFDTERDPAHVEEAALRASSAHDALFEAAAAEFDVPAALLKALAFSQTRYEMVRGEQEFEGEPQAFGMMALAGPSLARGAELAGVDEEAARVEPLANVRAAAALLSALAREQGLFDRRTVTAWAPVLEQYSGYADARARETFVREEVFGTLGQGVGAPSDALVAAGQSLTLAPAAELGAEEQGLSAGPDYAPAVWRPSPDYNARPSGMGPKMVIIHTCEGSYSSCYDTLISSPRQVSAHYVVNTTGSEVSQLVRESQRAWHIGATYDCARNGGTACSLNGRSANDFTIGIEHAGFASQTSFPAGQLDASAKLLCNISRDRQVPLDRQHVVGHGQLQPYDRTDPGRNWPWTDYLNRARRHCGATTGGQIIIDSNNTRNDTSVGYIKVSSAWVSSTNVGGYYGTGYFYARTGTVSDGASFWFYLPAAQTKTIDAWWSAAPDRSPAARFVAWNASGENVGTAEVNQRTGGGRWQQVGTFSFTKGWNRVALSRKVSGDVVIADAVRVR